MFIRSVFVACVDVCNVYLCAYWVCVHVFVLVGMCVGFAYVDVGAVRSTRYKHQILLIDPQQINYILHAMRM